MTMKTYSDHEAAKKLLIGVKRLRQYIEEEENWIEAPSLANVVGGAPVRRWTDVDIERASAHLQEAAGKAVLDAMRRSSQSKTDKEK
jgi:hypothetical protein